MNIDKCLIDCILPEKLIFKLTNAHEESFKNQIESLVGSELVETCSKGPEKGMSDNSGVLEGSLQEEFAKR